MVDSGNDVYISLVAGIKDNIFLVPFSAPFGRFHYKYGAVFMIGFMNLY